MVAQLVGAGHLFSIVFEVSFEFAVAVVAILIMIYVAFGGMLATTWVQIIKAALLIFGVAVLSMLAVIESGGLTGLFSAAEQAYGGSLGEFGGTGLSLFAGASLSVAIVLGMMGMPHLLIRFLTVRDPAAARKSVVITAVLVALVLGSLLLVVGPATLAYVKDEATFLASDGGIQGGRNMILLHLSTALGGEFLFGVITAVTFSTILAVVAGLTVAIASSASYDIFATLKDGIEHDNERTEIKVFRTAVVLSVAVAAILSVALQDQNIAYLSAFAFGIAASTNFPILILALYWSGLTKHGALVGGSAGLVSALLLLIVGPTIWVQLLGNDSPLFPSDYSTLISAPIAFVFAFLFSVSEKSPITAGSSKSSQ